MHACNNYQFPSVTSCYYRWFPCGHCCNTSECLHNCVFFQAMQCLYKHGYGLNFNTGFLHSSMQCVRYQSHRTLFSQLRENRTKIAAIGSGCTLATEPAAEISHFWNIPQVQHVVLSQQLSFVLTGKSHQLKSIHLRTHECTNKSMQSGNSNFYLLQKNYYAAIQKCKVSWCA